MTTAVRVKTILFATDFLASSRLALDFAVGFAHHYKSKLVILHVFHMPQSAVEAEFLHDGPSMSRLGREKRLEVLVAGVRRLGIAAEWRLVEGWMPASLLEKTREMNPDLLVLGTHGVYGGLEHMLIGSNAEEVLLSARCPTLTVGRHVPAGVSPNLSFDNILYVTDFTPESAAAAPYAVGLSKDFHAKLQVCHLLPDGGKGEETRQQLAQNYCDAVRVSLPDAAAAWCSPNAQLEHAANAEEVLRHASNHASGLVVLGVKAESQFERHLRTSVAYQLVATAARPILTIRG